MFKVKAKFIGINSLGFIGGRIYEMIIINQPRIGSGRIEITTEKHKGEHDAEAHHAKVNNGLKQSVRDYKISKVLS